MHEMPSSPSERPVDPSAMGRIVSQFGEVPPTPEQERRRFFPMEGLGRAAIFLIVFLCGWWGLNHFGNKILDIYMQLGAELPLVSNIGYFLLRKRMFLFWSAVAGVAAVVMAMFPGRRGWVVWGVLFALFLLLLVFWGLACIVLPLKMIPVIIQRTSGGAGGS